MDLEKLVRVYLKIREARAQNTREYEARDAELKEKLDKVGNALLAHLNETGAKSVRTEVGTFYKEEVLTPSGSDWQKIYDWIKQDDAFDVLERRLKKTFISDYIKEHGDPPPGVSVYREYVARVRKTD